MRLKMLFKVFDERARRIALALTLTVVFALLSGVIAAGQTVYTGSVSAWWVVAGIFVWMLVVLSVLLGLARFQTKAESRGEESPRVGRNYVGPMVLSGGLRDHRHPKRGLGCGLRCGWRMRFPAVGGRSCLPRLFYSRHRPLGCCLRLVGAGVESQSREPRIGLLRQGQSGIRHI